MRVGWNILQLNSDMNLLLNGNTENKSSFKPQFIWDHGNEKKCLLLPMTLLYVRMVKNKDNRRGAFSRVQNAFPTESPTIQYLLLHAYVCALDII